MRPWVLMTIALGGVAVLLALRQVSLSNQIKTLRQQNDQSVEQQQTLTARIDSAEEKLASQQNQIPSDAENISAGNVNASSPAAARIAALESRVHALQAVINRQPTGPIVPEYDVTNPTPEPEPPTNAP